MTIRIWQICRRRSIVVALTLVVCISAVPILLFGGIVAAQQGDGQVWVVDMGDEEAFDSDFSLGSDPSFCNGLISWDNFNESGDKSTCLYEAWIGYGSNEMIFPLQFDLAAGTISSNFSGSGSSFDEGQMVLFDEALRGGFKGQGSFEGYIEDGWVRTGQKGWEFGGMMVIDVTLTYSEECLQEGTWVWETDTRSTQFKQSFQGWTHQYGQADDKLEFHTEDTDQEIRFLWDCYGVNLPTGFPAPTSLEADGSGADVSEESELEEFSVRLGCQPGTPTAGDTVICTADVLGAHEDETFEFHWYLDSAFVETTSGPVWTWGQAKAGPHDIGIQVVGEGRSAEADFTLTAGAAAEVVADRDGDGIPDDKDACRDQYAQTEDGCPTEAVAPVAPAADDGKPTSPSGVSNLVRNLEEFLAGQGVQGPTPGQAAGGAAAVSTLIGAWVLTNLLSGVSREDLLRAVHAWRHRSATPAPAVKPVPGNIKTSPPTSRLPEQPPEVTMTTKHPPMAEKKSPAAEQKKLERAGLISDEAATREDRIKGGKAVIENIADLFVDPFRNNIMKEVSELQDIVTLKKQFDKNGNFILKSMDDLENTRKQLVKQIERGRKLRISDKLKKVSAGVSHALEVFDGIDHVMKVGAQRGYKGVIDYGCAIVAESGHKFILYTATKHPLVGLADGLVSVINPDYNVESWMRSAQDHWHDVTREYFDNIYTNDDAITSRLHEEFQRHKDRISRTNLPDAEKLKRIKKLYKILLK
jgi:hypothetical protein